MLSAPAAQKTPNPPRRTSNPLRLPRIIPGLERTHTAIAIKHPAMATHTTSHLEDGETCQTYASSASRSALFDGSLFTRLPRNARLAPEGTVLSAINRRVPTSRSARPAVHSATLTGVRNRNVRVASPAVFGGSEPQPGCFKNDSPALLGKASPTTVRSVQFQLGTLISPSSR